MGAMKRLYGERHLQTRQEDPRYDRALRNNLRELVMLAAKSRKEAEQLTPAGYVPFVLRSE